MQSRKQRIKSFISFLIIPLLSLVISVCATWVIGPHGGHIFIIWAIFFCVGYGATLVVAGMMTRFVRVASPSPSKKILISTLIGLFGVPVMTFLWFKLVDIHREKRQKLESAIVSARICRERCLSSLSESNEGEKECKQRCKLSFYGDSQKYQAFELCLTGCFPLNSKIVALTHACVNACPAVPISKDP